MGIRTRIDSLGWWQSSVDRRRVFRHPVHQFASIDLGNGSPLRSCMISDISESGARLTIGTCGDIPDTFTLLLHRRCRVVRRLDGQIGVQFVTDEWIQ
jgi:hypothetical protein